MAVEEKVVSREFKKYIRKPVADPGFDETVKKLTTEKIEKTINSVLKGMSTRVRAALETCIHCALCSDACHWYLSHDKDTNSMHQNRARNIGIFLMIKTQLIHL